MAINNISPKELFCGIIVVKCNNAFFVRHVKFISRPICVENTNDLPAAVNYGVVLA